MNPGQQTYHSKNFESLRHVADQAYHILHQNPHPNKDTIENLAQNFKTMDKAVGGYCAKTPGTEAVLSNFNKAKHEFELLQKGKGGDVAKIAAALQSIAQSHYVAPALPPVAPPRPTTPAPTVRPNVAGHDDKK